VNIGVGILVPIVPAYAIFAEVQAVPVPKEWSTILSPELWGILQAAKSFTIRQHVKLLPKTCCACPPCVQQENTYSVYAGLTQDFQAELMRIDEVSSDWNRCCCAPNHPLRLEARQYIPMPGDNLMSDYSHLRGDLVRDFNGFDLVRRQQLLTDMYKQQPVLMSMVRDDGLRACCRCPCKCLNSGVCFACCQDGMHIYAGKVNDDPENDVGRPYQLDPSKLMGSVYQPIYGGCCTPTMHMRDQLQSDESLPYAKLEGPCIFGGCSEFCCDFEFPISFFNSPSRSGDIAKVTKKKPDSLAGAVKEAFTDADVYTITFNNEVNLTPSQKATILASQLLADYVYFDGNTEKCQWKDEGIYIYCFYCSCIGKICPCYFLIPTKF